MFQDYDKLHAFYLMVKHGGPTGAARTLNVSQPAVSRKLKDLEDQLEIELVLRKQGSFVLSQKGKYWQKNFARNLKPCSPCRVSNRYHARRDTYWAIPMASTTDFF